MTSRPVPELSVPCPTCYARSGQPCRSRRAVSLHQARREALAGLEQQAGRLLAGQDRQPAKPENRPRAACRTELAGKTGEHRPEHDEEFSWPPWESGPAPLLAWLST